MSRRNGKLNHSQRELARRVEWVEMDGLLWAFTGGMQKGYDESPSHSAPRFVAGAVLTKLVSSILPHVDLKEETLDCRDLPHGYGMACFRPRFTYGVGDVLQTVISAQPDVVIHKSLSSAQASYQQRTSKELVN